MKALGIALMLLVLLTLAACGGGNSMSNTTPPPSTFTIGGTVTGLAGSGLVLQNNGGNNLAVKADGSFTFTTAINSGTGYKVTVMTQPSSPAQTCAVTGGSGTANANVTSVTVACTTTTHTIGGTITGLAGTGLVLQNNLGDNLNVTASQASFTFATAIDDGASYSVTVLTQPSSPAQNCVVTNASGKATSKVTGVVVTCTTVTHTVGGTVTGLAGSGLVLQNNGGNNLTITANGAFTFSTAINSGASYSVSVLTQPSSPVQNCVVTSGSGTAPANVTSVVVTCTTVTYTIGGTVSGLVGSGLVLQNNGGDDLTINANGGFTFSAAINSGAGYKVTVLTQPSPGQICSVTGGSGTATAKVTSVVVTCTAAYTIGGSISNLSGSGLVLLDNNADSLPVTKNSTSFTFATPIASGATYSVTVPAQPTSPWQTCAVTSGGSGTATADVTNVVIACTTNTYYIEGTVAGLLGSGLVLQDNNGDNLTVNTNSHFSNSFQFVTKIASENPYSVTILTQPSSPAQTCWVGTADGSNPGTVQGTDVLNVRVGCSDNWVYENGPETASGPEIVNENGNYGSKGSYNSANLPGGRYSSSSWTDTNGNYWLFGGFGYDSGNSSAGNLNDLWEYSPSMGQWRWVDGSSTKDQKGVYTGTAYPGARDGAVSWTDASGNFWLFGGYGYDSGSASAGDLNDLWEYNPTTGTWTFVSGSTTINQLGVYSGTEVPGSRDSAVGWIDASGNLWMFGGNGCDSASCPVSPALAYLSDLWEFNPGTKVWTWINIGATSQANQPGTYGVLGKAAITNVPGGRYSPVSWIDKSGNLWLFGGFGKDGDTPTNTAELNDLWEYKPGTTEWTWMGGSHIGAASGVYGSQTVAASGNVPGARQGAVGWTDANGDFWMFGGLGFDSTNLAPGELNDLWKYSSGQWAWMSGSTTFGANGVYGSISTPDPTAVPGGRGGASGWIDSSGNLWVFGGNGPKSGVNGAFNDLWQFQP